LEGYCTVFQCIHSESIAVYDPPHQLFNLGKNGFVTATKLGTTDTFFVAATKILLQQPNVLLTELNILLLSQNVFVIPIVTNDFVSMTKPFFP